MSSFNKRPPSAWPGKVLALIQSGNAAGALLQIKVAPTVKDLQTLRQGFAKAGLATRYPDLDRAIGEHITALSAPRLHRSP